MTAESAIAVIMALFGAGGLGAFFGRVLDWRRLSVEREKMLADIASKAAEQDAKLEEAEAAHALAMAKASDSRTQALLDGMGSLVSTLQGALDRNVARADAKAEGETKALQLASQLAARLDDVEAASQRNEERLDITEAKLKACEFRDTANIAEVKRLRERLAAVEKRTSGQNTPAQR